MTTIWADDWKNIAKASRSIRLTTTSPSSSISSPHETAPQAIDREKQIKRWRREKKIALIESANPEWLDLSNEIL